MKKIISLIITLVTVVSVFASCSSDVPANHRKISLYFANADCNALVTETAYIPEGEFSDIKNIVKLLINKLIAGPSDNTHMSLIPDSVYVRGVSVSTEETETVNIDLGGAYYGMKQKNVPSIELLARYSMVKTVCQLDGIKRVKFYVNGYDMKSNYGNGEILSSISSDSILINSPSSVETQTEKFVTLYFADKSTGLLSPETRKATMSDNSLEKTVVNELLRGPVNNNLERTIPEAVSLISIETTEDVCFVNLSSAFMTSFSNNPNKMKLAVYSIVNSLTRLSSIDKVQILIDGKKAEADDNSLFNTPLERDDTLINENVSQK